MSERNSENPNHDCSDTRVGKRKVGAKIVQCSPKDSQSIFVSLQKFVNSTVTLQLFMFEASGTLLSSQIRLVSKCKTSNRSSYIVNSTPTFAQSCNAMKTSVSTSLTPILSSFCCSTYSSNTCHNSLRPGSRRFDSILQG